MQKGLQAERADALDHLQSLKDKSVAVISGFHIAEHLPFDNLKSIVEHTLRVLKPGGLLILGFIFTTWLAGKIYRTGILMYGQKVNYAVMWKWLRQK